MIYLKGKDPILNMKKILIIKMGYSETLDRMLSLTTSLGDVIRTTFILNYFKNDNVSWLVDGKAAPLLEGNKHIKHILIYSPDIVHKLKKNNFDLIVNFEKSPEICLFVKSLKAKKYMGFGFNGLNTKIKSFDDYLVGNKKLIEINKDINKRKNNQYCWQKILADALEQQWNGEEYILGYKPCSEIKYDIGFNWTTSNKWANKTWPHDYWLKLRNLLKGRYSISWQEGMADLHQYIDWLNSCRLVVTSDSLGLHLGLALKKKVIALFGPTSPNEIYFYNSGISVLPEIDYSCIPCLKPVCDKPKNCMEYIFPEKIKKSIDYAFKESSYSEAV